MNKILVITCFISVLLSSCSVKNICENFHSDNEIFRSAALASSNNPTLATERALFAAKQRISKEVDQYIKDKYQLQTLIEDEAYEARIITARKTVLNDVNIICNRQTTRRGVYYGHIAIEISRNDIESHVNRVIKQKTQ